MLYVFVLVNTKIQLNFVICCLFFCLLAIKCTFIVCKLNIYVSLCIFSDSVGCVDPEECMKVCGAEVGCSNIAFPKLVIELMPSGN